MINGIIRSGQEIVTNGLVLHLDAAQLRSYPGSGTTWSDLSGNNNNGTLTNGPTFNSANGGSIVLDGSNDFVNIPHNVASMNFSNAQTICMWLRSGAGSNTLRRNPYNQAYGGPGTLTRETDTTINYLFGTNGGDNNPYVGINSVFTIGETEIAFISVSRNQSTNTTKWYKNGTLITTSTAGGYASTANGTSPILIGDGYVDGFLGNIYICLVYNIALTDSQILQNYNALKSRFPIPDGTISNPFLSPLQAQDFNYPAGSYYFRSGLMSSAVLLEYQPNYYESKPFCCVFRSPYRSTATTNRIGLNIPMAGLLVQRDTLDIRAAVYWSAPITYNAVGGTGNNTANSGYSPRRVILGSAGGHGIYATNQSQCNWPNATGAIGAGWDGSTCGSFPNDLVWGTGVSNTAVYANRSGTWSHWVTWNY